MTSATAAHDVRVNNICWTSMRPRSPDVGSVGPEQQISVQSAVRPFLSAPPPCRTRVMARASAVLIAFALLFAGVAAESTTEDIERRLHNHGTTDAPDPGNREDIRGSRRQAARRVPTSRLQASDFTRPPAPPMVRQARQGGGRGIRGWTARRALCRAPAGDMTPPRMTSPAAPPMAP